MSDVNKSAEHSNSLYLLVCDGVNYSADEEILNSLYSKLKFKSDLNNSIAIMIGGDEIGVLPESMVKEVLEAFYAKNQQNTLQEDVTVKLLQKLNEHLINCLSE